MMIFVTWTERRAWLREYGKPVAALWLREGTRKDLEKAEAYAATERGKGTDMKVYATTKYELYAVAKAGALAAHK